MKYGVKWDGAYAAMNFNYELEIPADTSESSPEKLMMKLTFGILTKVYIIIPTGHAGLAHLKIMYHESQLYPLPPSTEYHGDGNEISFEERQPIFINPYELKAIGWNTDDTYAHSFLMNFTITLPETLGIPAVAPDVLEIVRNLIGAELIIPPPVVVKPPKIPPVPLIKQGLIIMSKPTYAAIYINEIDTGKLTKEKIELEVGEYTITLIKEGYEDWERIIAVKEGEFKEVRAELPEIVVPEEPPEEPPVIPPVQGLIILSAPSYAKIFIDDVDTGKLTREKVELPVGEYTVRLEKDNYESWDMTVTVKEGEFKEIRAELVKVPGVLPPVVLPPTVQGIYLTSSPSKATIYIDDVDTGKLTTEKIPLDVGSYKVRVELEGYKHWEEDIAVIEDKFIEVHAKLEKIVELTIICTWIDETGIPNLTKDHALYIYYKSQGWTTLAARKYDTLTPKPAEIPDEVATKSNALGVYYYSRGWFETANRKTKCRFSL